MSPKTFNFIKAFTLCAGFFSLSACKERSAIRPDLIPNIDNINTFGIEDFEIGIKNSYFDSLISNNYAYPVVALGQLSDDPFFGKTQATMYMQFVQPSENFAFPAEFSHWDSVVLHMPYYNVSYGDTAVNDANNALSLKAYEITDNDFVFNEGVNWFTFQRFQTNVNRSWGSDVVSLKSLVDTFIVGTDTLSHIFSMRLDNSLGDYLRSFSPEDFASAESFKSKFKGLYIAPDSNANKNTLAYMALYDQAIKTDGYRSASLTFYYHNTGDTAQHKAIFSMNGNCAFSNAVQRNYTGKPAAAYLNAAQDSDTLLIQGYPGFKSDLTIKLDDKIPASVINKAALEIVVMPTQFADRFAPPPTLSVMRINADNTIGSIADLIDRSGSPSSTNLDFVDAQARRVTINGRDYFKYIINLPREVQQSLNRGDKEIKLRINTSINYPGAYRMLGFGPNAPDDTKIKFHVIYTKQNQP